METTARELLWDNGIMAQWQWQAGYIIVLQRRVFRVFMSLFISSVVMRQKNTEACMMMIGKKTGVVSAQRSEKARHIFLPSSHQTDCPGHIVVITCNWKSSHWIVNAYRTIRTGDHLFEARVIFAAVDRFFVWNDNFGFFVVSEIERIAMLCNLKRWTIKWHVIVHEFWRMYWRSNDFILCMYVDSHQFLKQVWSTNRCVLLDLFSI